MTRRANPEWVYAAQRAGVLGRPADRPGRTRAEDLVNRWEKEADARGLDRRSQGYWDEVERWFEGEGAR